MKANELMIGDWVMLNPDLKDFYEFAGKPCQVIGLHDDDGAVKIDYDNGKYFWTDAEEDVIPIPLTPEILEKNGFGYKEEDGYSTTHFYLGEPHYCMDMDIHIGTDNNGNYWLDTYRNTIYGLRYVHELQHAMRLCKIEKEITL